MPRFAANLGFLFTEVPFLQRFAAARAAGFSAVEFPYPYDYDREDLLKRIEENKLEIVLFNLPPGNWEAGERGIANDPSRIEEFRAGVEEAISWALDLGSRRINCLAGKIIDGVSFEEQWKTLSNNIKYAAEKLGEKGLLLTIEPINRFDIPGFFVNKIDDAIRLLDEVKASNAYIQFDVYHVQRTHGELTGLLRRYFSRVGHIQIADNPGRHQPGTGEINYNFLLREMDALGYKDYVSLEYIPHPDTLASLNWIKEYGVGPLEEG
ncbi:MAG: TIM barrel protein [Bacillota bacterium]